MQHSKWLLAALIGLAQWFFGNLYEEITLVPNQLINTYEALRVWRTYFTVTNPVYYYVPLTQLAVVVVVVIYLQLRSIAAGPLLAKAALFGVAALALTAVIVTQLNFKLFFGDLEPYRNQVYDLSVLWLLGNALRLVLVGAALVYTFRAYQLTLGVRSV